MGLNLPADNVCFAEIEKYDGREHRLLKPDEVRQIGGRAGRYLLSTVGQIGATTAEDLKVIGTQFETPTQPLTHARVAPTVEDIAMIPGHLAERLEQWSTLGSIPEDLRGAIQTADMDERIELASMLAQDEVDRLGLEAAMKLINAPTQLNTRTYWRTCATAILFGEPMPLPPSVRSKIETSQDLEWAEMCIRSADIYLWLANRHEFMVHGPDAAMVRTLRTEWSKWIDEALVRKVDTAPRCNECGRRLPYNIRFRICDRCFRQRRQAYSRW
jgi:ATP-dependent RNA helicase SUPV3L1/SUV3